jgi:phage shock protein PspC (stress-responsive transcriptional regulator)
MGDKKLMRADDGMIAGVCSGLADYFGLDVTLVRIIYVLATFFTAFAGCPIYLILWVLMPKR